MFNPFKKVTSYTLQATRSRGFSLVELLVVIAIIGILAAGGGVYYTQAQKQSRDLRRQSDLAAIQSALELYYSDTKSYPTSDGRADSVLLSFLKPDYLSNFPQDPKKTGDFIYQYQAPKDNGDCNGIYALYTKAELKPTPISDAPCQPAGSGWIVINGGK